MAKVTFKHAHHVVFNIYRGSELLGQWYNDDEGNITLHKPVSEAERKQIEVIAREKGKAGRVSNPPPKIPEDRKA